MLIEVSVENFRSVKEEVTLSMLATSDDSLEENLIKTKVLKKDSLLKSAVIYGPNASGKSNILRALLFLKALVQNSHNHQKGMGIHFSPFKLDKSFILKPTKLKVVFIKNNLKYVYGVSFNGEKIIDEFLYYYPSNKKKAVIFERHDTNKYNFTIDKSIQKFISQRTLDNVLYLSKSTQEKYEKTTAAFDWFKEILQGIGTEEINHLILTKFTVNLLSDPEIKKLILKALNEADFGIKDIATSKKKIKVEEISFPKDMPQEIKDLIFKGGQELEQTDLKMFHKVIDENDNSAAEAYLDIQEESEGTKRFFSLIGPWIDALNKGIVLIVDELEIKLHPFLNKFLIKLFHLNSQNKNNAKLIFTTHNTELLDQKLFRRDQIWFTEKKPASGSTDLYSLVEFSPRKDKDIKKGYLTGRYGALPFIREGKIF